MEWQTLGTPAVGGACAPSALGALTVCTGWAVAWKGGMRPVSLLWFRKYTR